MIDQGVTPGASRPAIAPADPDVPVRGRLAAAGGPLALLPVLFLLLLSLCACGDDGEADEVFATVVRCLDGDTVELSDGRKVRYLGVDTPELKEGDCYAEEAKVFNELLVLNQEVELVGDAFTDDTDQFGRYLRYVYIETPGGPRLVNKELLLKGYAWHFMDSKLELKDELRAAEAQAQASGAGLWCACEEHATDACLVGQ